MSQANDDNLRLLVGKPCPRCGEKLSLKRTVFAHGACEERIWADGEEEVYTDGTGRNGGLYFTRNQPWRCMDCGKKIPNAVGEGRGTPRTSPPLGSQSESKGGN